MSDDAYCLLLMKRALARSDADLFGLRHRYEARLAVLVARIFAGPGPTCP